MWNVGRFLSSGGKMGSHVGREGTAAAVEAPPAAFLQQFAAPQPLAAAPQVVVVVVAPLQLFVAVVELLAAQSHGRPLEGHTPDLPLVVAVPLAPLASPLHAAMASSV